MIGFTCETTDGKEEKCVEFIESVDEEKKTIEFNIHGLDIEDKYNVFHLTFQAIEDDPGSPTIKWSIEYERQTKDVRPPYLYLELYDRVTRDVDAYLFKN